MKEKSSCAAPFYSEIIGFLIISLIRAPHGAAEYYRKVESHQWRPSLTLSSPVIKRILSYSPDKLMIIYES